MNHSKYLALSILCLLISACANKNEIEPAHNPGLYLPFRQDVSPIKAFTKSGAIDIQKLDLFLPPTTIGGNCIKEQLEKVVFSDDSIRLVADGRAWFYFDFLGIKKNEHRVEKAGNNLMFRPATEEGKILLKFSPASPLSGVPVADPEEAAKYYTKTGRVTNEGFSLISYSVVVAVGNWTSGSTVNYLDLDYLRSELPDDNISRDAILLYVERETFFKKVNE